MVVNVSDQAIQSSANVGEGLPFESLSGGIFEQHNCFGVRVIS